MVLKMLFVWGLLVFVGVLLMGVVYVDDVVLLMVV